MFDGVEPTRPRILLADDEQKVRDATGAILHQAGFDVETAADGKQAVERLKSVKVDALVLDLQMPEHDGFETLEYVREHRRGLPIVLLSGLPPDEIQGRMVRRGTEELPPLFQKPCDPDMLLSVLEMLLAGELPPSVQA
jgi:CheY-like chemotaxis protein